MALRIGVVTVSDAGFRGERADDSGDAIVAWLAAQNHQLSARRLVPDETLDIVRALCELSDAGEADVVLTTGGTGLTPRDVTPEATRAAIEREAPGIAEALRASVLATFPAPLSPGELPACGERL